jgi:PEP-CTERM motif-containing protein
MKKFALLAVLACGMAASSAKAQVNIYDNFDGATFNRGQINGGATDASPITFLVADDINFATGQGTGAQPNQIVFGVFNSDPTATINARPRLRFWNADGAGGGPGTLITGFSFSPITFAANAPSFFSFNPNATAGTMVLPSDHIWAGITFDNVGATATTAQLNELGVTIVNPVTVGTSADQLWTSATPGSQLVSNPAGTINVSPYGGAPLANEGWRFQVAPVPEPTSLALVGLFGAAGIGWRRWRKK